MSGTNDVQDILGDARPEQSAPPLPSKETILSASGKKKSKKQPEHTYKRPEGMSREVYALLCSDNTIPPPLVPSDTTQGYKAKRADLGRSRVKKWSWMPFKNPARKDALVLSHWRRVEDEGKDYAFARFNKHSDILSYTDEEYTRHLADDQPSEPIWSREETDHLFTLCRRFDGKFVIIHDRFDYAKFQKRSMEDIKERYYDVCNKIAAARNPSTDPAPQVCAYDAQHETLRKQQLEKLYSRSKEQVQEEISLLAELRKIDTRRKERERRQMDLNKLMAAPSDVGERKSDKKKSKKKSSHTQPNTVGKSQALQADAAGGNTGVFKPYDRTAGVSLRSSKIKLYPTSFPQRRTKVIDAVLDDLGVGINPIATEKVCVNFNALRNNILLLLELKSVADGCDFEVQTLKHQYEALLEGSGGDLGDPRLMQELTKTYVSSSTLQIIDVMNTTQAGTSVRKRRATSSVDAVSMLKRRKT